MHTFLCFCILVAAGLTTAQANPLIKDVTKSVGDIVVTPYENIKITTKRPSVPYLIQGDIRVSKTGRSGIWKNALWPNRVIPYKFEGIFASEAWARSRVHEAMSEIMAVTCLRFEPAQSFTKDWVVFTDAQDGCWSHVGKIGGRQDINLDRMACIKSQVAVHEILHAIGFGHEQTRPDRDKYITFKDPANKDGIDKEFSIAGFPYDWGSIMHYEVDVDDPRMSARAKGVPYLGAGPSNTLSAMDAAKINAMYGCDCP